MFGVHVGNHQPAKVYREIGYLLKMQTKSDVIQGAGELGQNDVTRRLTNSTGVPPDQKSKQS
jgi:hypothetical protein